MPTEKVITGNKTGTVTGTSTATRNKILEGNAQPNTKAEASDPIDDGIVEDLILKRCSGLLSRTREARAKMRLVVLASWQAGAFLTICLGLILKFHAHPFYPLQLQFHT